MTKKKFTKMKISVDTRTYNKAILKAESKIENFDNALKWVYAQVDEADIDIEKFNNDMESNFRSAFLKKNEGLVNKSISYEKLLFLLDVDISPISKYSLIHNSNDMVIELVDDETVQCKVDIENYTIYTKNEDENRRLIVANNLINAVKMVSEYSKCYPLTVQQATSNFITFDITSNEYSMNLALV
tara:strand:+ start:53 stop:610 length:558 start_codon:yes stop_codon:yes gene_type:complete